MPDRVPTLFSETPSPLDRIDARAKLVAAGCVVLYLFLAPSWPWLAALLAVGLVVTVVAGFPLKWLAALWLFQVPNLVGLMLLPAVSNLVGGDFAVTELDDGLRMSFALLGAITVLTPLLWSMGIDAIAGGLRGLKVPRAITFAVAYAFRLLHATLGGALQIMEALKAKGVHLESRNPFVLLAALPKVTTATVFVVARRANAMMAVLRMRGFSAGADQAVLRLGRLAPLDLALVATGVVAVVLAAAAR
jgi:energy-coupling factor transport system permease protein